MLNCDDKLQFIFTELQCSTEEGDGFIVIRYENISGYKDSLLMKRIPKLIPEARVLDFQVAITRPPNKAKNQTMNIIKVYQEKLNVLD